MTTLEKIVILILTAAVCAALSMWGAYITK